MRIAQHEIDAADELVAVFGALTRWLRVQPNHLSTCGWGPFDRKGIAANARMHGVNDPFAGRPHIDLRDVMTARQDRPTPISRDELRALAHLPANPRRHRALDDALDLTHFLALLFAAG